MFARTRRLTAGTAVPTSSSGFVIAGDLDLFGDGPTTCELILGGLSERCGGRDKAFLSAPKTTIGRATCTVVPVRGFRAPPE